MKAHGWNARALFSKIQTRPRINEHAFPKIDCDRISSISRTFVPSRRASGQAHANIYEWLPHRSAGILEASTHRLLLSRYIQLIRDGHLVRDQPRRQWPNRTSDWFRNQ